MPITTTIPTAQDALVALLRASADLTGVTIFDGYLVDAAQMQREQIVVGDVEFDQEWGALGNKRKNEEYRITVIISALLEGDDYRAARNRGWELVGAAEKAVRTDPTLTGSVMSANLERGRMNTSPSGQAWLAEATCEVVCRAQLTLT